MEEPVGLVHEVVWDKDGDSGGCLMQVLLAAVAVSALVGMSLFGYYGAPALMGWLFRA